VTGDRGKRWAGVGHGEDANQLVILGDDRWANMVLRHRTCYRRYGR
jgi:hypothetical protein